MTQPDDDDIEFLHHALTKREYFAGLVLQALIANGDYGFDVATKMSVQIADDLIDELNRPKEGNHD